MGTLPEPVPSNKQHSPRAEIGTSWIFFIAARYLRTRRRERKNTTSVLSMLGLAIGVATLITVLSVMNAFQTRTIESIINFNSYHLRISGVTAERLLESPSAIHDLRAGVSGIKAIVPFAELDSMARGYFTGLEAMRLRAVPPEILRLDEGLAHALTITGGSFDLSAPNSVILGQDLARALGVGPGDRISVLVMPSDDNLTRSNEQTLVVTGTFSIGYYEYDRNTAFISLDSARAIAGDLKNMTLGIKLEDRDMDWLAMQDITRILVQSERASRTVLGRELVSWRQYNSAIFGALRVEKLMMMLIIGLIFVVVAVNIFHDLRRSVFEKTEDIGILRALGAPATTIQFVFILEGCAVGFIGGLMGVGLGWLISGNINEIFQGAEAGANFFRDAFLFLTNQGDTSGRISLFFIDRVPSRLFPVEAIGIGFFAFLSAAVAAFAASRRVSRIRPAEILRIE